ncbi:MAG: DUF4870 domain-containing protein [Planctomycetota bacterium]|jgi:uncharacterized Tic20 family protein
MSIAIPAADDRSTRVEATPQKPGRLRQQDLTDADRNYAIAIHLSPLAAFAFGPAIIVPLILWLIRKDESAFDNDHGREMVNAILSFFLYHVVAIITLIGIIALPALYILGVVNLIRGAVAAGRGEYFRYPMTIRFIS